MRGSPTQVRLRPALRLLLTVQAEGRTGRLLWGESGAERALLMVGGLVVGSEGHFESFLEYLARTMGIAPGVMAGVERRVRDLFVPFEKELARTVDVTVEEIAARRRDFTVAQIAELLWGDSDGGPSRFSDESVLKPGAACRIAPATTIADILMDATARGALDLTPATGARPGASRASSDCSSRRFRGRCRCPGRVANRSRPSSSAAETTAAPPCG